MWFIIFLATGLITLCSAMELPQGIANDTPLGCNMRLYTYRITQSDSKGNLKKIK